MINNTLSVGQIIRSAVAESSNAYTSIIYVADTGEHVVRHISEGYGVSTGSCVHWCNLRIAQLNKACNGVVKYKAVIFYKSRLVAQV